MAPCRHAVRYSVCGADGACSTRRRACGSFAAIAIESPNTSPPTASDRKTGDVSACCILRWYPQNQAAPPLFSRPRAPTRTPAARVAPGPTRRSPPAPLSRSAFVRSVDLPPRFCVVFRAFASLLRSIRSALLLRPAVEPLQRAIDRRVLLAKARAHQVPRRLRLVERAHRNQHQPPVHHQSAAERDVVLFGPHPAARIEHEKVRPVA